MENIKNIENIENFHLKKDLIIKDRNGFFYKFDYFNDKLIQISNYKTSDYIISDKFIVSKGLNVFDIESNDWIYKGNDNFYPKAIYEDKILFYKSSEDSLTYFSGNIENIKNAKEIEKIEGNPFLMYEDFIFINTGEKLDCYKDCEYKWSYDVSEIGAYENFIDGKQKGSISKGYLLKDKIIIIAELAVVALDFNGSELWRINDGVRYQRLKYQQNYGYLITDLRLSKINIEDGSIIFTKKIDDISIGENKFTPQNNTIIQQSNDNVWFCSNPLRYNSVIIKLDLETLEYNVTYDIGNDFGVRKIKLHEGNIYVLTNDYKLMIIKKAHNILYK